MIKVKKIKLSGFRGILQPQELNLLEGAKEPRSLALFGLNSSGKTSFVDGLEWFLSEENKIRWLRRDEAEERSYPHQAAKERGVDSFVEIHFYNGEDKINIARKTFDHDRVTRPLFSPNEASFKEVYSSFVVHPYFRYLEIVDFVCSKAYEKYQSLARWMGFENEFEFQEKVADILIELRKHEKMLGDKVATFRQQLQQLLNRQVTISDEVLGVCNLILQEHGEKPCKTLNDVWEKIPEINKRKSASSMGVTIDKLAQTEAMIAGTVLQDDLAIKNKKLRNKIDTFCKEKKLVDQINVIGLYDQALEILTKQDNKETKCPVCGKDWERIKLIDHIKNELSLLTRTKKDKEEIEEEVLILKNSLSKEVSTVRSLIHQYEIIKSIIPETRTELIKKYLESIEDLITRLDQPMINQLKEPDDIIQVLNEKKKLIEVIKNHITKIQPSEEEIHLAEDTAKLNQIKTIWQSLELAQEEQKFTDNELNKFDLLRHELVSKIERNIENRFREISERIGKYFAVLRDDKDIKNIEIKLNKEKGRAAGRSAEIQLTYYDISVKPAYKVLSESLLNSLGLAVYFTCVKQFNQKCKFIVLDDIMNSLDTDKRDTLLDLLEEEFSDYQIILFTHDYFWFQKIVRRFPDWITKKIKGWDYIGGSKIDSVTTTREEIDDYLSDSARIEEAGWKLTRHVESVLNELCENIWAPIRYRYAKNDPPALEELFDGLYSRLRDKLKTHEILTKVQKVKQYEPLLRNFVSHARNNQTASVSTADVKRAATEWFSLEKEFWCPQCKHFVTYIDKTDKFICKCNALCIQKNEKGSIVATT